MDKHNHPENAAKTAKSHRADKAHKVGDDAKSAHHDHANEAAKSPAKKQGGQGSK